MTERIVNPRRRRIGRLVVATALLAVTVGAFVPPTGGEALGPVVPVTPPEISGTSSDVTNAVLSGRGEDMGLYDQEVQTNGWVLFDVNGPEAAVSGQGITVSGNACATLSAIRVAPPPPPTTGPPIILSTFQTLPTAFVLDDRC